MKKYIAFILALALCLTLAACGPRGDADDSSGGGNSEGKTPEENSGGGESSDSFSANVPVVPVPGGGSGEESENGEGSGGTPSIAPGFPSIGVPGAGGGEAEDIPVTDAGDLVDKLAELCEGVTPEGYTTATLYSSGSFANYFGGGVTYTEGMRVAENTPMMVPPAHIALLIEVPEGQDADEYAKELTENANPRWNICATAESVQSAARDGLVLFVMSSAEIADALIAAFNGE